MHLQMFHYHCMNGMLILPVGVPISIVVPVPVVLVAFSCTNVLKLTNVKGWLVGGDIQKRRVLSWIIVSFRFIILSFWSSYNKVFSVTNPVSTIRNH